MKYYSVGAPVLGRRRTYLGELKRIKMDQKELEKSSFYNQKSLRLFISLDAAKEYAEGLTNNAEVHSKSSMFNKKIRPIFTLDLDSSLLEPYEFQTETFIYEDYYLDGEEKRRCRVKQTELSFYLVNPKLVEKQYIIQAEFFNSGLTPVEFFHEIPNSSCCILS